MGRKFVFISVAVLVAFALAIGLSAQAQEKSSGVLLTAEELKTLIEPSLLISGRNEVTNFWFGTLLLRNGILYDVLTDTAGNGGPITGKWRLDGDKFCRTSFPQFPQEVCRNWYRVADGSYESRLVAGGKLVATFRIVNRP